MGGHAEDAGTPNLDEGLPEQQKQEVRHFTLTLGHYCELRCSFITNMYDIDRKVQLIMVVCSAYTSTLAKYMEKQKIRPDTTAFVLVRVTYCCFRS